MSALRKCVGVGAALFGLAACYGPHTITYIDSAREAGNDTHSDGIEGNRVDLRRCPGGQVARIETYTTWADTLVSYLTFSTADRSVEITCVKR
jgi:hypothetical protein